MPLFVIKSEENEGRWKINKTKINNFRYFLVFLSANK